MERKMWRAVVVAFFILLIPFQAFTAQLVVTSPPRESVEAGKALYQPLADYLSKILGQQVNYKHPNNWLTYQHNMRKDQYDVVFDGPHFAAWRIAHLGNRVLVKLPGTLQFVLVTKAGDSSISAMRDLVGKRICGIPPPNLSALTVLALFENPMRQPLIKGIKGGMGAVYQALQQGHCKAAVLRISYYKKQLSDADRSKLKVFYTSPPLPNQVITVSKRISDADLEKIQRGLLYSEEGKKALEPIRERFGGKQVKSFVKANQEEYNGHNKYLEGIIFGW